MTYIRNAVKKYAGADLCIFACFDFKSPKNTIPSLLFSDWTYDILIRERLNREPYKDEVRYSEWQREAITQSEWVITLFRKCHISMKKSYPTANIYHMGINVVNDMNNLTTDCTELAAIIENKFSERRILFIGNEKYIHAAEQLIKSFEYIKKIFPDIKLDIIGLNASQLSLNVFRAGITIHGYLHKEIENERQKYYQLLKNASVLVNCTKKWGAYSSVVEAMFYYTPIIVSPFDDFVMDFGKEINFGYYIHEDQTNVLSDLIVKILSSADYTKMCINAHNAVKNFTWNNYVDRIVKLVTTGNCEN